MPAPNLQRIFDNNRAIQAIQRWGDDLVRYLNERNVFTDNTDQSLTSLEERLDALGILSTARSRFYARRDLWSGNSSSGDMGGFVDVFNTGGSSTGKIIRGRPGVYSYTTGTSASHAGGYNFSEEAQTTLGDVTWYLETSIRLSQLSTASERFEFRFGLLQSNATGVFDGVYIAYRDDVNSGKFYLAARSDSTTPTTENTDYTVAADTWYRLGLLITSDTKMEAFVDGVSIGTKDSGFPGDDEPLGPVCGIFKQVGTGAVTFDYDYVELSGVLDTPR